MKYGRVILFEATSFVVITQTGYIGESMWVSMSVNVDSLGKHG